MLDKDSKYSTIQIKSDIKHQISDYCDMQGYKISGFMERLFLQHVSGSQSGSHSYFAHIFK